MYACVCACMANFILNSLLSTVSKARCWRHRYKGDFLSPFPKGLQSPGEHGQVNNDRDPATWEQPEHLEKTSELDSGRKTRSGGEETSAGSLLAVR